VSELYRPSDCRLSAKLGPTFADRVCRVVSATDPHGLILGLLDRSRHSLFQVAPQLYSGGWVDPVSDPLLLRKSGSAGNRTRGLWTCNQKFWPLDHRGGHWGRNVLTFKFYNFLVKFLTFLSPSSVTSVWMHLGIVLWRAASRRRFLGTPVTLWLPQRAAKRMNRLEMSLYREHCALSLA
jgi:hypothetical protein